MTATEIVIARRFRGPDQSGNGGYVCGLLAKTLGGAVEVTLKAPPPLETPLTIETSESGARLMHGDVVLADAVRASLDVSPPAISLADAEASEERYPGHTAHLYPECFVCGPKRGVGDGLRIFTGPEAEQRFVAAVWSPEPDDCDSDGRVATEILWAALDCPGYFSFMDQSLRALLGRMSGETFERPKAGERCIVTGWKISQAGRKHVAGSAVAAADGRIYGRAMTTWIELRG